MKNKAMVYPYDRESGTLIRYKHMLKHYDIISAVALRGSGYVNKSALTIDGGVITDNNLIVTEDFYSAINQCESVIIAKTDRIIDFDKVIAPKIKLAKEMGKEVIFTYSDEKQLLKIDEDNLYYGNQRIYDIKVPVIGVMGMSERCGKMDIQLALRQGFLKNGYKVSQIGSKSYCELFGFHSFPKFMLDSGISESNKVMLLNHMIKKIEVEEKPDVIIIGIPGAVMPYSNNYTSGFGITAFEVCNAVQLDSAVVATLYNDYKEEYYRDIAESLKYKLGAPVHAFNIYPLKGDFEDVDQFNRFKYITLSSDFIDKKIKLNHNMQFMLSNVMSDDGANKLYEYIEEKLASYGDIKII